MAQPNGSARAMDILTPRQEGDSSAAPLGPGGCLDVFTRIGAGSLGRSRRGTLWP